MKKVLLFLIAACVMMTSCKKTDSGEAEMVNESVYVGFDCTGSYTDSGELYINDSSILTFVDRRSGISTPLCSKPDCKHEGVSSANPKPECSAYVEGSCYAPAIYGGKLYFMYTPDTKDISYEGFGVKILCRADKDGTNRQEIARLDNAQTVSTAAYGDGMFACGVYKDFDDKGESLEKRECYAAVIDLESGRTYQTPVYSGYNGIIRNICTDDKKMYFAYTYTTEQISKNDEEYIKSIIRTEIICFDRDEGNVKTLYTAHGDCADIGYGYALINEDKPCTIDLSTGRITTLENDLTAYKMTDMGIVMYGDSFYLCDTQGGKTKLETEEMSIAAITDSYIYVLKSEGKDTVLGVMDKGDFLNGRKTEIKKLREV